MDLRGQLKALMEMGVSLSKIAEPLHRSTISKYVSGEKTLSEKNEEIIKGKLKLFKEQINNIL